MQLGRSQTRLEAAARRFTTPALRRRLRGAATALTTRARALSSTRALIREPGPLTDFNHLLHELRGAHLTRIGPTKTLLSAGCAGRWYFDWIDERVGTIERHIGLEAYSPKPDDLPAHVTWIANDTADMHDVASGTVDVVFSGQNIEHLWPEQVAGFLCEANRVLADGGRVVVDSPNRLLTEPLGWSHPEHTVELAPSEIAELLALAGFRVDSMEGLWLCRAGEQVLPLVPAEPNLARRLDTIVDRSALAAPLPDDSFVWWCVAGKIGPADPAAIAAETTRLFESLWPARCSRFVAHRPVEEQRGRRRAVALRDEPGPVASSPAFPLRAGRWRVGLDVVVTNARRDHAAAATVAAGPDLEHPLVAATVPATDGTHAVDLDVELASTTFGMQVRVTSDGNADVAVPFSLRVEPWP